MNFTELLENSLSLTQAVREDATQQLEKAALSNFEGFVQSLVAELENSSTPAHLRQAAGVNLKNNLTAKNENRRKQYAHRWLQIGVEARSSVKTRLLGLLNGTSPVIADMAAQIVGIIAAIEIAAQQWLDVISLLLVNMQQDSVQLKIATLKAIGYICEACDEANCRVLENASDQILTAIVQGARENDAPGFGVKLAAVQALYNSLEFNSKNFNVESERNHIMQVVCEATLCPNEEVQVQAYENLVKIMHLHYDKMYSYMERALFGMTISGMRSDIENVALQAIEFWSTVCEEEYEILEENAELINYGEKPQRQCFQFAKLALNDICPTLLSLLAKHEEDDDDDDWSVYKAAATCLALMAVVTGNDVVPRVLPFVQQNISSSEWRSREAAVMAFGSIIEGPEPKVLGPIVQQALDHLINLMGDVSPQVRDTVAWALGRIAAELHEYIDPVNRLPALTIAVCQGLEGPKKVASSCVWCLMNIGEKFASDSQMQTSPVSQLTASVIDALFKATVVPGVDRDFRAAAYEAAAAFIANAAVDCEQVVYSLTDTVLSRLQQGLELQNQLVGVDDREAYYDQQASLCAVLAAAIRRLDSDIAPLADNIMNLLLQLLQSINKASTVTEDIFLAVDNLATAIEANFQRYWPMFSPFLISSIRNFEAIQTCAFAIGLVGDISRALESKFADSSCNDVMSALAEIWNQPTLHNSLKPIILTAFGDIALAIGPRFQPFLEGTMGFLSRAVVTHLGGDAEDDEDFLLELQESIVQTFVGIIQGFKGSSEVCDLLPYIPNVIVFAKTVAESNAQDDTLIRAVVGLLGDIADGFPKSPELKTLLQSNSWIESLFAKVKTGQNYENTTKEVALWARDRVKAVLS